MKVFLDTVGCRLNQSEIEEFANQFRLAGHSIVSAPGDADLVIVNTCAVTAKAASDSRQKSRQAAHAGAGGVVLTGCWASLEPDAALALPQVRRVILNADKESLVADVLGLSAQAFDLEPLARQPLPGLRQRTRAFIKVQDGCDNHCTFCITRVARGAGRSRPQQVVLNDVRAALDGGAQEIVLTGVQLGGWGMDFEHPQRLVELLRCLLRETNVPRLRLSSLEPWDIDDEFFTLWSDERMCRHLHLPLQSGSASVLRRMARKITPSVYAGLINRARTAIPDLAVTTDVIVGFPGEGDTEFEESLNFIREMDFAGGHVFSYNARPGTPAAGYPQQVPFQIRKNRSAQVRACLVESERSYSQRFIGQTLDVLWEATPGVGPQGWLLSGLTDNYLRVAAASSEKLWNRISPVKIMGLDGDGLCGEIIAG